MSDDNIVHLTTAKRLLPLSEADESDLSAETVLRGALEKTFSRLLIIGLEELPDGQSKWFTASTSRSLPVSVMMLQVANSDLIKRATDEMVHGPA